MRLLKNRQNLLSIGMLALLLALALPGTALADQRGSGRGRDDDKHDRKDDDKRDRKCAKFVNCHDARDGRRDGRGPRRDLDRRSGRRHDRIHDRLDRRHSRFHNRNNRRFDVREVNRTNTVRFRRARG